MGFKPTRPGGPKWEHVIRRITKDLDSGEVLADDNYKTLKESKDAWLYRSLPEQHDIETELIYGPLDALETWSQAASAPMSCLESALDLKKHLRN